MKDVIPDEDERRKHIFTKQLYGIAITEMTSLLSRRSLYCSKYANTKYSIVPFKEIEGNIRFKNTEHYWEGNRCGFCGANKAQYDRDENLEQHAYELIHTIKPEEIFGMKFDVICGNPPYQISDGGHGASAIPIYQKFVEQAQKLNPRYLTMIIPSRWFAGGRGLDGFRDVMLNDNRIRHLVDYFNSEECFPGVDLSGGVCYFLWDRDHKGMCIVKSILDGKESVMERPLLERGNTTFLRFNETVGLLRRIAAHKETSFMQLVSANDPFGYDVRVKDSYLRVKPDIKDSKFSGSAKIYYWGKSGKSVGYVRLDSAGKNVADVEKVKVLISRSYGERGRFPYLIIGKPFIGEKGSVCTETYIMINADNNEKVASNIISYMQTKFFRFLVMLKKNTQSATRQVYEHVPVQDFTKSWDDQELYKKYGLNDKEIAIIDSMVRPMD